MDILKPILDIYDTKKEVLLFYLDASIRSQIEDFDYEGDDLLNIDLTLRYDYFKIGAGPAMQENNIERGFRL